jgi:hypothetical protein
LSKSRNQFLHARKALGPVSRGRTGDETSEHIWHRMPLGHLFQHQAEREDIAARISRRALQALRREVHQRVGDSLPSTVTVRSPCIRCYRTKAGWRMRNGWVGRRLRPCTLSKSGDCTAPASAIRDRAGGWRFGRTSVRRILA